MPPVSPRPAPRREPTRPRATDEREQRVPDSSQRSTAPEAPAAQPPIDWYLEAERVLQDNSAEFAEAIKPKCRPSDHPGSLRPECRAPERPSGWEPEPRKFGIDGLIPWVRVGERCVVGLGFFGCGVGKLPEADGDLFDGMHDPDRPVSSVPDVDE